jgi:hypothetical protein
VGVSLGTAFRLRHRFLTAVVTHQPTAVTGLVEADETYFPESQKGSRKMTRPPRNRGGKAPDAGAGKDLVPVLVAKARRSQAVADKALTAMTADQAEEVLKPLVGPDTLLCIDGSGALRKATAKRGVTTKFIAVSYDGRVSEGIYHVQTGNNYHERLKTWTNRQFRGVATKYLDNHLAWMRMWEWSKEGVKPKHFIVSGLGRQLIST